MTEFTEAARQEGADCARVDDRPLLVWKCFRPLADTALIGVEVTSTDDVYLSYLRIHVSKGSSEEVRQVVAPLLTASYDGPETESLLEWLAEEPNGEGEQFGPVLVSWYTSYDGHDLQLIIGNDFVQPAPPRIFEDFHVKDALDWGKDQPGLSCDVGSPYEGMPNDRVRCTATTEPRAALDFHFELYVDDEGKAHHSTTDISYIVGRFVPADENGGDQALADHVASLVKYISGNDTDGDRASAWVLENGGTERTAGMGVFGAELSLTPDDTIPGWDAQIKLYPTGYVDN